MRQTRFPWSSYLEPKELTNRMNELPHFVLFSRSRGQSDQDKHIQSQQGGSWYFRIQSDDGRTHLEATDVEPGISRERLELLAVVRGLEAFPQPSRVTLITTNPQISRSVRQGLDYWRERGWTWERFGEKVPMTNRDLWQRIDRALQIHEIRCRTFRMDRAHAAPPSPKIARRPVRRKAPRSSLQPLAALTRLTANSLHGVADSLLSWLPDSPTKTQATAF